METPNQFLSKHSSSVISTLSCYDRLILKGDLPITNEATLNSFVDDGLKIKGKDFIPFAEQTAETLVEHAKAAAREAKVEYRYLPG